MKSLVAAGIIPLLVWGVITDLKERKIPNAVPAGIAALWVAFQLAGGAVTEVATGLAAGVAVLAATSVAWRFRLIGGGDVKLLGALSLWAGGTHLVPFLLLTAVLGGGLALAMIQLHRAGAHPFGRAGGALLYGWRGVAAGGPPSLPYGVAIALAGAWLVHQRFWS